MSIIAFVGHLANFLAPALVSGLLLAVLPRLWPGRAPLRRSLWQEAAWLALAGILVLLVGLWWTGRDGRMATYAALVLVQGSVAWHFRKP